MANEVFHPLDTVRVSTQITQQDQPIADSYTKTYLVVQRIDNLTTQKSYTTNSDDWEKQLNAFLQITGTGQLVNGKATWYIRSKTKDELRVILTTQIVDDQDILIQSNRQILSPVSDLYATVISPSDIMAPATIRADDSEGLRITLV